jgi:hypothetical protein
VVKHLPSMCEALGSISNTTKALEFTWPGMAWVMTLVYFRDDFGQVSVFCLFVSSSRT